MSNFRAIATVTATLQRALQTAIQADVPGATVSTVRPGEGASTNLPTTGVNIFLYEICTNPHRNNDHLPTRNFSGDVVQRPQIAVDLHYLLSFYGDELTLEPQRLLGSTLAYLSSQPLLTRSQIASAVGDATKPFLATSDLADQTDLVRLTPLSFTLDELSRLWSVFLQTHYVLSVPFKASSVIVERQLATHTALPTRAVHLAAIPLRHARIDRVASTAGPDVPILPGSTIVATGVDLAGNATRAEIDDTPMSVTSADGTRVTLTLPASTSAGPHVMLVRQGVDVGAQDGPRWTTASNLAAFVVHPVITKTNGAYDVALSGLNGSGPSPRSGTISLHVAPDVGPSQTATLELLSGAGVALTVKAAARGAATGQLNFTVNAIPVGDYVLRVRVDGADTPVDLDANGLPVTPKVSFP